MAVAFVIPTFLKQEGNTRRHSVGQQLVGAAGCLDGTKAIYWIFRAAIEAEEGHPHAFASKVRDTGRGWIGVVVMIDDEAMWNAVGTPMAGAA